MEIVHTDFLVLGSGIAGLSYSLKLAYRFPEARIVIVTKDSEEESNTRYAQGGIAAVLSNLYDSYDSHIEDTLIAGAGLCNREVVEMVVKEGAAALNDLINWGVDFDVSANGFFDLALEGGHGHKRILHHKDFTGYEIEMKLLSRMRACRNISILPHHFAVDLIGNTDIAEGRDYDNKVSACFGAYVLDTKSNRISAYVSGVTLLATGGVGQVYENTTNPVVATGDGIAMAHRMGARISGMEFIQFHPTALKMEKSETTFLISEAVRGYGGRLVNSKGVSFVHKYDVRGDLAPRDIVARAIHSEMKEEKTNCVFLDCRHLDMDNFKAHFATIYHTLLKSGIDPGQALIPVAPAAHYLCGGIETNLYGQTAVKNLLACGECANTGLHGANRLASNSLLEAAVFANRCYLKAAEIHENGNLQPAMPKALKTKPSEKKDPKKMLLLKQEIKAHMQTSVGIVRNDDSLQKVSSRLSCIMESLIELKETGREWYELRNLCSVALLIVQQSIARRENAGGFYKESIANRSC